MNGLPDMNTRLHAALNEYNRAKHELLEIIPEVQRECSHDIVLHTDLEPMDFATDLAPLRMCVRCRVEEEGHMYSTREDWNAKNLSKRPVLGNSPSRLVVETKRDNIYKLRLPGGRHTVEKLEN